jgi:hypothetical protein
MNNLSRAEPNPDQGRQDEAEIAQNHSTTQHSAQIQNITEQNGVAP